MRTKLLTSGVLLLLLLGYFLWPAEDADFVYKGPKLRGLSFVAPRSPIDSLQMAASNRVGGNYLAFMPYAFLPEGESELRFVKLNENLEQRHQWWGEQPAGVASCIQMAKAQGLGVLLKPHIWSGRGTFTGDLSFASEAEWQHFEKTYRAYLLQYAQLAEEYKVEMFCIGTEMAKMVEERPQFWKTLIHDIRQCYGGKLTYAENWDSYADVPFWKSLDFIGIDGYFPLSSERDPDLETLKKGWKKHLKGLGKTASTWRKPILFTEFGYRSCDFSAEKPWEIKYDLPSNFDLQARAFEACFQEVWKQQWFAGGFVWKWFPDKDPERESRDKFCPQHKPAEEIIKKYYRAQLR
ncbi:hypothetical protein LAG90_17365 [Marinilongibacter aquaticus]|uniref:glycoside hydrolase family 113 n=1 Tax=Marinilongibacter aquaticus TaxID=2975157 RepID=UPI0021BDC75F|nr:hypothetical protein [Marinilongibacter aquaticus]UBM58574.1 hypothetical protein LAG90_17365 [Marinilongibacter aquaticus]